MGELIYDLQGVRGRRLAVYEDRVIITVKATFGSLLTGNASDGEKTIYFSDVIGIQYKKPGLQIGYLQFETASTQMNNGRNNFFNENSFTFDNTTVSNEKMENVADFCKRKFAEVHTTKHSEVSNSVADEILKLKNLQDMGIISENEFEAKKTQLLGL